MGLSEGESCDTRRLCVDRDLCADRDPVMQQELETGWSSAGWVSRTVVSAPGGPARARTTRNRYLRRDVNIRHQLYMSTVKGAVVERLGDDETVIRWKTSAPSIGLNYGFS